MQNVNVINVFTGKKNSENLHSGKMRKSHMPVIKGKLKENVNKSKQIAGGNCPALTG